MNPFLVAEIGDRRLEIYYDEDPLDPRKEYDNVGVMLCWHNRYSLGDKNPYETPSDFEEDEALQKEIAFKLPLYLYDHSGITMSTGRGYPFNDPWDAGQVGWIYATKADVLKKWGKGSAAYKKARAYLEGEVETYDQYLTGRVYGYMLKKKVVCDKCGNVEYEDDDSNGIGSCWGFYGDTPKEAGVYDELPEDLVAKLEERPI